VKVVTDCSDLRYAILEALQNGSGSERFVIAYRDEHSLRDLIADACIVSTGFSSRFEAVEHLGPCVATTAA
jgi:hypothetical protein